jgi:hypothetical protein
MRQLWEFGYCLRVLRARMRFGQLSRGPLRFLRIEVREDVGWCDWIARPPELWDDDLPLETQAQRASLQALEDALVVRELVFLALPDVQRAELRSFRTTGDEFPELVIEGSVQKAVEAPRRVVAISMRAILSGFRFWLEDGILRALDSSEPAFDYAIRGTTSGQVPATCRHTGNRTQAVGTGLAPAS